jgi:uncharacterized protein (DUF1015 family)
MDLIDSLKDTISPPYDVISEKGQADLYERSPFNMIRLEYPIKEEGTNTYEQSANTLKSWEKSRVLQLDPEDSLYLVKHSFTFEEKHFDRYELIGLIHLEPWSSGIVLPHEHTSAAAKNDRLEMLRKTQTNLSPIMAIYDDSNLLLQKILDGITETEPTIAEFSTNEDENYSLWKIDDQAIIKNIQSGFTGSLYIADGHHRYETALDYRSESVTTNSDRSEGSREYIMGSITMIQDPGLISLPYHRILHNLNSDQTQRMQRQIDVYFNIEEIDITNKPSAEVANIFHTIMKKSSDPVIGFMEYNSSTLKILTIKNPELIAGLASSEAPIWSELSPCLFSDVLLQPALGILQQEAEAKGYLSYTRVTEEAIRKVQGKECDQIFLLDGVPIEKMTSIAQSGERLPHKSTYFHPKVPTGFVLNRLTD